MIRIAYLITDLEIGGTERVLERLVTHLDRRSFTPMVVSLVGTGPIGPRLREAGIEVAELKMAGKLDARSIPRAAKAVSGFAPDIVHTFLFHANVMGRLVSSLTRVPRTVCSVRTTEGRAYYFPLERFTSRGFDRVVCASGVIAEHVRRRMGVKDPRVIYNGVPIPRNSRGIKADLGADLLVATAGRLAKGKGGSEFVALAAKHPEATFVLIGTGDQESLLKKKAGPNVHFAGHREDVPSLLVDADLFVHASSLGEGFPNAVAEAMAAGCAVVAGDSGGTKEVVGDAGVVTRIDRIPEEAARLLRDPAARRAMGEKARRRAEGEFSISRMVESYEGLYRELIS